MESPSASEQTGADLRSLLAAAYAFDDDDQAAPRHDEGQDASGSGTIAARHERVSDSSEDKTSMDSKAFDLREWMDARKFLSLDTLFSQHKKLKADVDKLQSQMQTLVYDNYSRFIDATDVIHNMRNDFKGMAKDTSELQRKMTVVAQKSESVNSNLQTQRAHLADLNQLHNVLRNLQAVLNLPQELHEFVAAGEYATAVELYSRSQALLKRYGHRGILREVKRESDAIIAEVKQMLLEQLQNPETTAELVTCTVQLLVALNVGPDLLRTRFLAGRRERLDVIMREVAHVVACLSSRARPAAVGAAGEGAPSLGDLAAAWGEQNGDLPCLDTFIVRIDNRLLSYLTETVLMYHAVFSPATGPGRAAAMDKHIKALAQEGMRSYVVHIKNAIAFCGAAAVRSACEPKGELRIMESGQGTQDLFQGDWGVGALIYAIDNIKASLSRASMLMPELFLRDKSSEVVEGAIRHHVGAAFAALEQLILDQLAAVRKALKDGQPSATQLSACVGNLVRTLTAGCESLLKTFKRLADNDELLKGWQDVFVDLLQAQLQHLFLSLVNHFHTMSGVAQPDGSRAVRRMGASFRAAHEAHSNPLFPSTPDRNSGLAASGLSSPARSSPDRPGERSNPETPNAKQADILTDAPCSVLVLVLACFCKEVKDKVIASAVEAVARYISGRVGSGNTGLSPPAFVAAEVQRRLSRAVTALLNAFVQLHASQVAEPVAEALSDLAWLRADRVGPPRAFVGTLQTCVQAAAGEALMLLPRGDALPFPFLPANALARHSRHGSMETDDQQTDARVGLGLFQDQGRLAVEDAEANVHSVVIAVTTTILQSIAERVRQLDLSQIALHQLQVDLAALRQSLNHARVRPFLDDILSSGLDRCDNPVLMDAASVDALLKQS